MGLLVIACNVLTVCLALYSVFVTARERPLNSSYKAEFPVDVTNGTEHAISKRDIPQTNALTESMRQEILDLHNKLRAGRKAKNMVMMVYDMHIETMSQAWADGCIYEHSPNTDRQNKAGYVSLGENLYATTGELNAAAGVQNWYDEVKDYNLDANQCSAVCGHYTQVVWHSSKAVGCGVKWCKPFPKTGWESGHYFVCRYAPGGNVVGMGPYNLGEPCSECPADAQHCINGLCSDKASTPPGSKASSQLRTSWTGLMLMFVIHLIVIGTV